MLTWGEMNDAARAKLAAFFAAAPADATYTAAQAGYLAGAQFAAYTSDALLRAVDALVASGQTKLVGYRAGSPVYRTVR